MEITTQDDTTHILGNIESINDFASIKKAIDKQTQTHKKIKIFLIDSLSITSSVIGYLNKLVQGDKIDIELFVSNNQLLELLKDLKLTDIFKVKLYGHK
jgi:hypothetical protein